MNTEFLAQTGKQRSPKLVHADPEGVILQGAAGLAQKMRTNHEFYMQSGLLCEAKRPVGPEGMYMSALLALAGFALPRESVLTEVGHPPRHHGVAQ